VVFCMEISASSGGLFARAGDAGSSTDDTTSRTAPTVGSSPRVAIFRRVRNAVSSNVAPGCFLHLF
jgi:hypothetical protein